MRKSLLASLASLCLFGSSALFGAGIVEPSLKARLQSASPNDTMTVLVHPLDVEPGLACKNSDPTSVIPYLQARAAYSQEGILEALRSAKSASGDVRVTPFWISNVVCVTAPVWMIQSLAERDDVLYIIPNFEQKLILPMNLTPAAEGEKLAPTRTWDNIAAIKADQVRTSLNINGQGVTVASLDTGAAPHTDFGTRYTLFAHFNDDGTQKPNPTKKDTGYPANVLNNKVPHGTHTSGTMVGGNASGQYVGVAPGATLISAVVIDLEANTGSLAMLLGGIQWAIDPDGNPATNDGARVVNMSLGYSFDVFPYLIEPMDNMVAANAFPSVANGNSGPSARTAGAPATVPSAFAVGAVDNTIAVASFSSRGPVDWGVSNPWDYVPYHGEFIKPDIAAPGTATSSKGIYSTVPENTWQEVIGSGLFSAPWQGTSMAAPHIAGVAALMVQANPNLTVDEIKRILESTAIDKGTTGKDNDYGYGFVDALAAVNAARNWTGGKGFKGVVTASDGRVLANAELYIPSLQEYRKTDKNGKYTFSLRTAGTYQVQISAPGCQDLTQSVTVGSSSQTLNITLNVAPTVTVTGVLKDRQTQATVAGSVSVARIAPTVVNTAADGSFSLQVPATGLQYFMASAPGYGTTVAPLTISSSGSYTFWMDKAATFEADNGSLTKSGSDWEWGQPTAAGVTPPSGTKCWATKLAGGYSNSSKSKLITPEYTVPADGQPIFSFKTFYDFQYTDSSSGLTLNDGGNIKYAIDGGAWTSRNLTLWYLRPISGLNSESGLVTNNADASNNPRWDEILIDIPEAKGHRVKFCFDFGSDSSGNTNKGWFVDDVHMQIAKGAEVAANPANPGDVNGDGQIDAIDVHGLLEYLNGTTIPGFQQQNANLDSDPAINAADLVVLDSILTGMH